MSNNDDTVTGGNDDMDDTAAQIEAWNAILSAIPAFVLIDHYEGREDVTEILTMTARRKAMESTLTAFAADLDDMLAGSLAACAEGGNISHEHDQAVLPQIWAKLRAGTGLGDQPVPTLEGMATAVDGLITALTPAPDTLEGGSNSDTVEGA